MSLGVDFERYQFDRRLKDLQDKVLSLNYRVPKQKPSVPQKQGIYYMDPQFYPSPNFPLPIQQQQPQIYQSNPANTYNDTSSSEDEQESFHVSKPIAPSKRPTIQTSRSPPTLTNLDIIEQQRISQQKYLEQMNIEQKKSEQQWLDYIDQQNKMIKQLTDQMFEEKQKKEKEIQKQLKAEQRQLELKNIEKQVIKRQQIMLQDMKNDILDSLNSYPQYYNYQMENPYYGYQPSPQQYQGFPIQQMPMQQQQQQQEQQQQQQYPSFGLSLPPSLNLNSNPKNSNSNLSKVGSQTMNKIDQLLSGI